MTMGGSLKERKSQYICSRDAVGTWRILDTWSPLLERVGPDDEIPDNSPAVTLVSEGKFIELIRVATQLGYLENAAVKGEFAAASEETESLRKEVSELKVHNVELVAELKNLKDHPKVPMSENFLLKERTMNALLRLALSNDIADLK